MSANMFIGPDSLLIQGMLDALDFYVLVVDEDHQIFYANANVRALLKLDSSEIIGKYCPKLMHGVDCAFYGCPLEPSVKSGKPETAEFFEPTHKRWMDSKIYPTTLYTPSGKRLYFHLTFDITDKKNAQEELDRLVSKLRTAFGGVIQVLQIIVEKRDPYTAGHQLCVSDLARAIATEMNLPSDEIDGIRFAGVIHDIGKIGIPADTLSKPGKLNSTEYELVKQHCLIGYEVLKDIDLPWPIAEYVYQHHEFLDGSGYPRGLKQEEILKGARILIVANVVEAMASHRPYRPAHTIDEALEEMTAKSGILYDGEAVTACLRLFREKGYQLKR